MAAVAAALLASAGCGGGEQPRKIARSPCPRAIAAVLGDGARSHLEDRAPSVLTCTYRAAGTPATAVRVTVDSAPQALTRFSRGVVERAQAHLGDRRAELPVEIGGVGVGAAWVAAPRELSATDGRRLVTVTVVTGSQPRATATAVARAVL
ncbi:hypothetical protein VSS74_18650 [Conexibacter stalactiti]|uniref:DUF3558 domain-containing protein n=1 Tax=Conexibacter stalactiti TaxID=1940611 RepID=A0ABU4HSS1_9ACTN|nr:hypothetical protein [Conexibacter stalactiti]MDW5596373.1 hypothetical protein [Conexibacter stalactiti]MEC5037015.1 hypothetical protein [Conexibacter stalactiti]